MGIKFLKQSVPLALMSAVVLFSCSNDETSWRVSPGSGVIGFSTAGNRFTTKVAPMVSDSMRTFRVWAYGSASSALLTNLSGAEVSRSSSTADWNYSPLAEWPAAGTVDFYAVSPASAVASSDVTAAAGDTTFTYTVPVAASQVDLLVVKKNAVAAGQVTTPVPLTFGHALSRIGLKVKTDAAGTGSTFKIEDVKLLNVSSAGTYSLKTGAWGSQGTLADYDLAVDPSWAAGKILTTADSVVAGGANGLMVLPQTATAGSYVADVPEPTSGTYLSLKVTLVNQGAADVEHTYHYPVVDYLTSQQPLVFEKGKQYTFNLTLSPNDDFNKFYVQFAGVTAESWTDGTGALKNDYTVIAGRKWANFNVDSIGRFTNSPEAPGLLYLCGGMYGYAPNPPFASSPAGGNFASETMPSAFPSLGAANYPCPTGWTVPTKQDLQDLATHFAQLVPDRNSLGAAVAVFEDQGRQLIVPLPGY